MGEALPPPPPPGIRAFGANANMFLAEARKDLFWAWSPGKSQKEGQEDQGTLKQLGGPLALLCLLRPPGLPSGLLKAFALKLRTPQGVWGGGQSPSRP